MTLCLFSALQDAFMHSCAYFVQGGLCIQLFGSIPSVPFEVLRVAQLLQIEQHTNTAKSALATR